MVAEAEADRLTCGMNGALLPHLPTEASAFAVPPALEPEERATLRSLGSAICSLPEATWHNQALLLVCSARVSARCGEWALAVTRAAKAPRQVAERLRQGAFDTAVATAPDENSHTLFNSGICPRGWGGRSLPPGG